MRADGDSNLTGAAPEGAASRPRWPWVLGAAFGLLYLCSFPARSDGIITGNDVVNYADYMSGGFDLPLDSVPNHLGYHALSWTVYRALLLWPGAADGVALGLVAQQIVAAAGGALALAAIAGFSARIGGVHVAVPFTCILGFTYAFWWSCAIGDSYVLALATSAWLLCRSVGPATGGAEPSTLELTAWLAASVVMRQDAVLIVPALAVLVPWRKLLAVLAGAAAASLAIYCAAWRICDPQAPFADWLVGLGARTEMGWGGGWTAGGLQLALRHLMCVFQPADWDTRGTGPATLALLCLATALAAPWPARAWRGVLACALHLLACFAFYGWWESGNIEYEIPMMLPFAAAFAVLNPTRGPGWRRAARAALLSAAAVAVAAGTWTTSIGPSRGQGVSKHSRLALVAAGASGKVFALDPWQMLGLLRERRLVLGEGLETIRLHNSEGAGSTRHPDATKLLRGRLEHLSRNGRAAVVIGDEVLRPDQIGPGRADPRVVEQMLRGIRHTPVLDERGHTVAWRIEPDAQ